MKEPDGRSRRCFLKASSMLGLAVAFRPATIGEAFADSRIAGKEDTHPPRRRDLLVQVDAVSTNPVGSPSSHHGQRGLRCRSQPRPQSMFA